MRFVLSTMIVEVKGLVGHDSNWGFRKNTRARPTDRARLTRRSSLMRRCWVLPHLSVSTRLNCHENDTRRSNKLEH